MLGVYERELEKKEVEKLVNDFTSRSDFENTIRELDDSDSVTENDYDEVKGFEVINETSIGDKEIKTSELTLYLKYQKIGRAHV